MARSHARQSLPEREQGSEEQHTAWGITMSSVSLESEKQGCQQPSCLCVKNLWRNYCRGSRAERQRREGLSLRTVLEHLDSAVSVSPLKMDFCPSPEP